MKKLIIVLIISISFNSCKPKQHTIETFESEILKIKPISENIFIHTSYLQTNDFGKVACNGMVYLNEDEAIVFDTPVDNNASKELIHWIEKKQKKNLKAIIATHFHNDCLGGLQEFHDRGIRSYANTTTIELAKKNKEEVLPKHDFEGTMEFIIGKEPVFVGFFGQGHTADNVVGYIPDEKALFGGCLIKSLKAGKGNLEDANTAEWPKTVEKIQKEFPGLNIVIPGHGKSGGKELLEYTAKLFMKETLSNPYPGQKLPGTTPEPFAPGIVSTDAGERDLAMSPDGKEIYFSRKYGDKRSIVVVKQTDGKWSEPAVASFSGVYDDIEPYIQPDGKKMFFVSDRPLAADKKNNYRFGIWSMDKTETGWSAPKPLGLPINGSGSVTYPTMTKTGTLYFTRLNDDGSEYIYRSKLINGTFREPEKLPDIINNSKTQYNAYMSPDEDFLVMPVQKNKSIRYHVSFRDKEDRWSKLIDLGDTINHNSGWSPSFSPDGRYFFFQRFITRENSDVYWVDAKIIKRLRPESIKK